MINLKIDKEALEHGIINLYTEDNVAIDEELSNEILLKTPCYDLAVSEKGELLELECDIEDLKNLNPSLFKGRYKFEDHINITFKEILDTIEEKLKAIPQFK